MKAVEELKLIDNTIEKIITLHEKVSYVWDKFFSRYKFNQATTEVKDIFSKKIFENDKTKIKNILDSISSYIEFLNITISYDLIDLSQNTIISHTRVKQLNSILYKLFDYEFKRVTGAPGSIPIKKCLNDLFGMRIITENRFAYEDLSKHIERKFPHLKCINSDKMNYKATHIYFSIDNFHYQWELQLWYDGDKEGNYASHKKHKQKYTTWEKVFNKILKGDIK